MLVLIVLAIAFHDDGGSSGGDSGTTVPPPASGTRARPRRGRQHHARRARARCLRADARSCPRRPSATGRRTCSTASQVQPDADSVGMARDRDAGAAARRRRLRRDRRRRDEADAHGARPRADGSGRERACSRPSTTPPAARPSTAADRGRGSGRDLQANIDDAVKGRTIAFTTGSAAIAKSGQTVLLALVKPLKAAGLRTRRGGRLHRQRGRFQGQPQAQPGARALGRRVSHETRRQHPGARRQGLRRGQADRAQHHRGRSSEEPAHRIHGAERTKRER